jgi:hypothetical protein
VFFATFFNATPKGIGWAPADMPAAEKAYIQDVAHRAVFGGRADR